MILQRAGYLEKLIALRDAHLIKIVTGIRRCGKTTLLGLYQDWLREHGVSEGQIVAIDLDQIDLEERPGHKELSASLEERIVEGGMTYIFLDEIHLLEGFPQVLNRLYERGDVDLYAASSSASVLSDAVVSQLVGRYVRLELFPFSFGEYKEYVGGAGAADGYGSICRRYLERSALPGILGLHGQPAQIRDHLEGLYSTIVVRDIVCRKKVTDTMMLRRVLRFVCEHTGSPLSAKKIADTLTLGGRRIDAKTVEKYLSAFTDSYILYQAKRYDIKGKQYLKTLEKYYMADMGLRQMFLGSGPKEDRAALENVVYLELRRRGYDVYVGKVDSHEVDFVAQNGRETAYYQIIPTVRDGGALEESLRSLRAIRDDAPRTILTLEDGPASEHDGVRCASAWEWLLEKDHTDRTKGVVS